MTTVDRKALLKSMRICRFCLTDQEPLTSIYERDNRFVKNSIPLPLQIMACVSIEVFASDGMPQLICNICRLQTSRAYKFKTHCKKSDDALKLFLATGNLRKPTKSISEVLEIDPSKPDSFEKYEEGETVTKCSNLTTKDEQVNARTDAENIHKPDPSSSLKGKYEEGERPPAKRAKLNHKNDHVMPHNADEVVQITPESGNCPPGVEEGEIIQEEYMEELEDDEDDSGDNQALLYEEYEELEDISEDTFTGDPNEKMIAPNVPVDVFPCTMCDRSFPLQQLLDIHMKNHERERKFRCPKCKKLFFSKYDLAKHETVHSGEKPFQCVVCLKTFARATLLHRHEKIHVEVPKYLCNTCDRTFLAKEELDRHEPVHKKNRPFPCDKCDKSFAFKQGLDRHAEIHRTDKPHKCNYCMLSFDTPAKLARHVTSHAGMRPYPCKFCPRTFLLSHHLTRHMRGHYANQNQTKQMYNYKCSECTMQFKRKDGLIGHSTIHSMVSLKCIFCSKQFDDLKLVREHVKTHMYGRIFPCEKCNYSFITEKHLDDHEASHCEGDVSIDEETEAVEQDDGGEIKEPMNIFADADLLNEDQNDNDNDESTKEEESFENNSSEESNVRRSQRKSKITDYAKFIQDELGIESEQESDVEEIEDDPPAQIKEKRISKKVVEEMIKPIIKPDGTKTYGSKGVRKIGNPPTPVSKKTIQAVSTANSTQSIDLPMKKINKGEIMEMKIGEKVVKVQKVLMTKAEVEEMARQGKIKMKGGAMLLKTPVLKKQVDTTKLPSPITPTTDEPKFKKSAPPPDSGNSEQKGEKSGKSVFTPSMSLFNTEIKKSVRTYINKGTPGKSKEDGTEEQSKLKETPSQSPEVISEHAKDDSTSDACNISITL